MQKFESETGFEWCLKAFTSVFGWLDGDLVTVPSHKSCSSPRVGIVPKQPGGVSGLVLLHHTAARPW